MKKNNIVIKDNKKYKVVKVINKKYIEVEPVVKTGMHIISNITYYLKISEVDIIE